MSLQDIVRKLPIISSIAASTFRRCTTFDFQKIYESLQDSIIYAQSYLPRKSFNFGSDTRFDFGEFLVTSRVPQLVKNDEGHD